ncbi:MAG: hypothetical protein WA162_07930 [Thermodesulfobacteriota bacterium]
MSRMLKTLFFIIIAVFFLCFPSYGEDRPLIKNTDGVLVLFLSEAMENALKDMDPTFKVWTYGDYYKPMLDIISKRFVHGKEAPFAAIGEFNGDGVTDVVLYGANDSERLIVGILSRKKNGYRAVVIDRFPRDGDPKKDCYMGFCGMQNYIALVQKGRIESNFEEVVLDLKTDAFERVFFERASVLYYHEGGEWKEYTTSD